MAWGMSYQKRPPPLASNGGRRMRVFRLTTTGTDCPVGCTRAALSSMSK